MTRVDVPHSFRMLLGLVCSAISVSVLILLISPTLNIVFAEDVYDRADIQLPGFFDSLVFIVFVATVVFTLTALPWLLVAFASEKGSKRRPAFFMMAGTTIAGGWFCAGYLFGFDNLYRELVFGDLGISDSNGKLIALGLLALGGGAIGGLTYWAIAGRHSGNWKSNP